MSKKISNSSYLVHVNKIEDDYFIEIPEIMLQELGWEEGTDLTVELKLGTNGNVLLISRKNHDSLGNSNIFHKYY